MFQEAALFPWLTAFGNVMFGLKLKHDLSRQRRRELAAEYLALVGLEAFSRANVHELSGGMKQRVALARALAPDPKVLLMDEPFASLDAMTRDQLYADIQRIWTQRAKTIVFVTHDVREAACLGDRVLLMSPRPGRIGREFKVPLPRPRDVNSPALAELAAQIAAALKEAADGKGWQRVEPNKSIREQKSGAEASEVVQMFQPMVAEIVKFGSWVQYIVKTEAAAKALVSAVGSAARSSGHGMRAEYAKLPDGTYAVQFKAKPLPVRKPKIKPAEAPVEAPAAS